MTRQAFIYKHLCDKNLLNTKCYITGKKQRKDIPTYRTYSTYTLHILF